MGAGGSTQAAASGGNGTSSRRASASRGSQGDKCTPSLAMQRNGGALTPLPSQFTVAMFNPSTHTTLSGKGVGVVLAAEALQLSSRLSSNGAPFAVDRGRGVPQADARDAQNGAAGREHRWFAEDLDRMGHWEPYNAESSQRLEAAFLSRKQSCLVTMRKRAYTVDLITMQQLPEGVTTVSSPSATDATYNNSNGSSKNNNNNNSGNNYSTAALPVTQRTRRVRRAAAKITKNEATGEEMVELVPEVLVDPFDDEAELDGGAGNDHSRLQCTEAGSNGVVSSASCGELSLPRLTYLAYPSTQPTYALDVTPANAQLSAEARAVGHGSGHVHVISGGKCGRLVEWDSVDGSVKTRYAVTASRPTSVLVAHYSPSARFVVCGCDDNDARLYRVGEPNPVYLLKGHTHKVYGVSVMAGEAVLATGSMDAHLCTWDIETGACTRKEQAHTSHIFTVLASTTNTSFCLSAGNDAIVCAHDIRLQNSVVMRLKGHESTLWDVGILPGEGGENVQFASAGMDNTIRLWDPRNPDEPFQVLRHHSKPVHSLFYMPNGKGLLSSGKDSFVFLSDTTTGEAQWRAKAQQSSVFRVIFQPDKRTVFTSGVGGLVNQWEWPHGEVW